MSAQTPEIPGPRQQSFPNAGSEGEVYVDSCLRIEHKRYFLAVKGTPVKVTKTEFKVISCLVSNINEVVRLEALWKSAWDPGKSFSRKSIHVFMSRIRRKLAPFGLRIDSVVDLGYILSHGTCCSEQKLSGANLDSKD